MPSVPILIHLLIPEFVFPVNKIDYKKNEKMVSKKSLKFLLNVYSEDLDFENFLIDYISF
jgi:hypothetical protein